MSRLLDFITGVKSDAWGLCAGIVEPRPLGLSLSRNIEVTLKCLKTFNTHAILKKEKEKVTATISCKKSLI